MARKLTEQDAAILQQMRAELSRIATKLDKASGPGVINTPTTLAFGKVSQGEAQQRRADVTPSVTNPTTVGSSTEGSETADSTTWARLTSNRALDLWLVFRMVYNEAGDEKLYAYLRKLTFDHTGVLYSVSAETRVTVDTPEDC